MTNHNLLTAINDTIVEHASGSSQHQLSVCVGYLLEQAIVTNNYCPQRATREDATRELSMLEERVHTLLYEGDVTPDCRLTEMHDGKVIGVAIGGEHDIESQQSYAGIVSSGIASRYQQLCR